VAQNVKDGLKVLRRPARRTGRIEDETTADRARACSREPTQWICQSHGLSESGRFTVNDHHRGFGREISRRETSPAGGYEQARKIGRHLAQCRRDGFNPVGHHSTLNNGVTVFFEQGREKGSRGILATRRDHGIRNRKNLGGEVHPFSVGQADCAGPAHEIAPVEICRIEAH